MAPVYDDQLQARIYKNRLPVDANERESPELARENPELIAVAHVRRSLPRVKLFGRASPIGCIKEELKRDDLFLAGIVRSHAVIGEHDTETRVISRTIFWRVLLPASLPGIFTGLRVSVGIGVTMLVGAEMVATSDGIAWMALTAADFVQTDIVLVGVLIMATLGYGLDQIFRVLERRVVHWAGRE